MAATLSQGLMRLHAPVRGRVSQADKESGGIRTRERHPRVTELESVLGKAGEEDRAKRPRFVT